MKNHKLQNESSALDLVYEYHDRTKHHFHQYARSAGYMDWDSQPDPFRRYDDASIHALDHPTETLLPTYDSLFDTRNAPSVPMDRDSISRLFYESLAISAWKEAAGNRWSLRVNPSSGDLHPTEAYLIAGPIEGLYDAPAVYHYSAYQHALERRLGLSMEEWNVVSTDLPEGSALIALTSIYWRESWKYGERAFRYCHHDVGHAIGSITFAATALGWRTRLIVSVTDEDLATLLGLHQQVGIEAEHPDCLLAIYPAPHGTLDIPPDINLPGPFLERLRATEFDGTANTLSSYHQEWPIIDAVAEACRVGGRRSLSTRQAPGIDPRNTNESYQDRNVSARKIIRLRRSAVSMDGRGSISSETFYRMMTHVVPQPNNNITDALPWQPRVSLALFIHRVEGLSAGLYLLIRHPSHEHPLREALRGDFRWERPEDCPEFLGLYLLKVADSRGDARTISCHQDIAADGVFAVGLLAEFDAALKQHGPMFYPRLFWETGLIGQILYLEAEASGIRSTGIGCFFDDAMHQELGIGDHSWQTLYHFTVGAPVDDPRLQTLPAYSHLT